MLSIIYKCLWYNNLCTDIQIGTVYVTSNMPPQFPLTERVWSVRRIFKPLPNLRAQCTQNVFWECTYYKQWLSWVCFSLHYDHQKHAESFCDEVRTVTNAKLLNITLHNREISGFIIFLDVISFETCLCCENPLVLWAGCCLLYML